MSAVFREMTCLRTNTAMFCSTAAPSIPAQFLFNPFLPSLTLTHCNQELTHSTILSHCSGSFRARHIRPLFFQVNTLSACLIWTLKYMAAFKKHGENDGEKKKKKLFTIPTCSNTIRDTVCTLECVSTVD